MFKDTAHCVCADVMLQPGYVATQAVLISVISVTVLIVVVIIGLRYYLMHR